MCIFLQFSLSMLCLHFLVYPENWGNKHLPFCTKSTSCVPKRGCAFMNFSDSSVQLWGVPSFGSAILSAGFTVPHHSMVSSGAKSITSYPVHHALVVD